MDGVKRLVAVSTAILIGTAGTLALGAGGASAATTQPTATSSDASASALATAGTGASTTATATTASPTTGGTTTAATSPSSSGSQTPTGPASPSGTSQSGGPAASSSRPSLPKARLSTPGAVRTPDLNAASGYLVAQLTAGHYYESFGFADWGMTIDGALSLATSRTRPAALADLVGYINDQGKDGNGNDVNFYTGLGTPYVGGGYLGKVALLAEATGYNPRSFAGHDQIAALDSTVCPDNVSTPERSCEGRGNYGNSASVFAQSVGVIAQLRDGDERNASDPIAFLEGLQHLDGSFPSLIPDSGDSDVDSTAMAAMALDLVPGQQAAVARALSWIAGRQLSDGGFPGAAGDSVNSAALAVQGLSLAATSYADQIVEARAFIAGQQHSDGGFAATAGDPLSDLRASTQALGGSIGTSFGTLYLDLPSAAAASRGAAYLVSQLVDGNHLSNDYGLTTDLAFALASANDQDAALAKVTGYLRAHVADYADPDGTSQYPGPYSGAAAKLALLAEVTGQDPRSFGGFDLLAVLTDNVCTAPDSSGYLCKAPGDFTQAYSTVSQALGVLALARAGVTPPAAAVARLEQLQCPDGGFTSTLLVAGSTCTSEVDTTGYAVQALSLIPGAGSAVDAARTYLLDAQQADGGYLGAAGENANSTGLGTQALLAIDSPATPLAIARATPQAVPAGIDPVAAGKAFLVSQQLPTGAFGLSTANPVADVRAGTQAVPALAGATLTSLVDPVTPVTPPTPVPPTSRPVTSTTGSTASAGGAASSAGASTAADPAAGTGALAATGAATTRPLIWALVLLLAGGLAMLAGRRGSGAVLRVRPRRRH